MSRRVQLVLEFEDSEPISGALHGDDGALLPFSGWLGLMAAIKESAGNDAPPAPADGRPSAGGGEPAP
jgi:hypothetical protein